jgi:hypothetical protein
LVAIGIATAVFVLRGGIDGFGIAVVAALFAVDLVGVYFIMQYGLSHDGLPHVDKADDAESVQKLRQMNAQRIAKIEAGRARAALTAGTDKPAAEAAPAAPKRAASRRRAAPEGEAAPAAE